MVPLIKKLFYKNTDKWIEKLLEIPWGIPNDKWIKYRFNVKNNISGITRQEIAMKSQNMINCMEFPMGHSGF